MVEVWQQTAPGGLGRQTGSTRLIVNADDFGTSPGVNDGIAQAHRRGIVTSASLMVRGSAARQASDLGRDCPRLGIGLHLDLGEWEYRDAQWRPRYEVVPLNEAGAVAVEVERQLEAFRQLVGRDPTHLDSHQHVHRDEPVRSVAIELAQRLGVPLRHFQPRVRYCGAFYAQTGQGEPLPGAIEPRSLIRLVSSLSPGFTELACHPARVVDFESAYAGERLAELAALCDADVRRAVESAGVELCTFREVCGLGGGASEPNGAS
jgi:predicted glycoside hydrolase/deacetylase ChbG (UPF0249 family)